MLQRTKGRLLLALLVITGLAGTFSDKTLTKEERKNIVTDFKETRGKIIVAADGLSEAQLNYKPEEGAWSISECLSHIALSEQGIWSMLEGSMKGPANPEMRDSIKVTDAQLVAMVKDRTTKRKNPEFLDPSKASWKDAKGAIAEFKKHRNDHIKYARTTTEDLRNHIVPFVGTHVDGYQVLLLINAHSERHYQQIVAIRSSPGFPQS
ncbi:MAG: DinB family protein [Chitinophagaceae bacterium]